ncbi:MAG: hypothetical protein PVF56_22190 [Desulfobacterales bacterium]|jgi:hypothetical protein
MQPMPEPQDFIHPDLGQEVTAIGGHYVFNKEARITYDGREVFYLVGYAVVNTSCCGVGGCAYALVPGFVNSWKYKTNINGASVSQIEPVRDTSDQQEIRRMIQKKELVQQVTFGF